MSTDFTVILSEPEHFGNETLVFENSEPTAKFRGSTFEYTFDCPNVNPDGTAILMFQSRALIPKEISLESMDPG
jgi:hypothetical protein